ncbi:uncharacterized protein LOC135207447 [Macrobrachium nipponense]|uniref:uncharacterized protein LOC135207447 n=1 Tax=Macrobrachium nipponense TaxID=159736 RepID=UPI0030C81B8B
MVSKKGNKASQTSSRPVLQIKNIHKKSSQTKEEKALQKKILKKGLSKKGKIPIGNIALEKTNAGAFEEKNKSIQRKFKKKRRGAYKAGDGPGIVCLTNLPHGFYEKELMLYFQQFGDIKHSKVVRSKLTGRSCGYAYVEFKEGVVAKIAAETMNNYLTYGKIIKCRLLTYTKKRSKKIFGEESFLPENCPKVLNRRKAIKTLNATRSAKQIQSRAVRVRQNFDKKLKMLQELGVNLDLDMDTGNLKIVKNEVSAAMKKEKPVPSDDDGSNSAGCKGKIIFEADQSDDEIILKTPPFAKKKFVKITPSSPAVRVSGKSKVTEATPADDTPKSVKPTKSPKTPKVNKARTQMSASEKKIVKKRKVSQVDVEGNNSRKQKRLSL